MKRLNLRTKRPALIGLLITFSLIVAACGSAQTQQTPASTQPGTGSAAEQTPASAPSQPAGDALPDTGRAAIQVADSAEFGRILVTTDGRTLYTNTVDTPQDLKCTKAACTGFWPPYTVDGEPAASEDLPGTLGTVTRPDGSTQVTYNQQPLYTFYLDKQPGDVKGNGFTDFGGTWHVVALEGALEGAGEGSSNDNSSGSGGIDY